MYCKAWEAAKFAPEAEYLEKVNTFCNTVHMHSEKKKKKGVCKLSFINARTHARTHAHLLVDMCCLYYVQAATFANVSKVETQTYTLETLDAAAPAAAAAAASGAAAAAAAEDADEDEDDDQGDDLFRSMLDGDVSKFRP